MNGVFDHFNSFSGSIHVNGMFFIKIIFTYTRYFPNINCNEFGLQIYHEANINVVLPPVLLKEMAIEPGSKDNTI